jgi:tripartite-type tricarboxylate transporter receptor subunit TctC
MAIAITRTLVACALLGALPAAAPHPAATAYPERPVRVVVPVAPGGSTDLVARIMSGKLGDALGRTFVVDNRAGAGALIGTDVVAKAAPDGYTLLFAYAAHTIAPFIFSRVPYDVFNDFTPITLVASQPLLLTINPSIGTSSVKELIALAKAKPGQLNVGLATPSSSGALIAEWFRW